MTLHTPRPGSGGRKVRASVGRIGRLQIAHRGAFTPSPYGGATTGGAGRESHARRDWREFARRSIWSRSG